MEEISEEMGDAILVNIFKKGTKSVCGNYHGTSLFMPVGKVAARILLNHLLPYAETVLPETQSGFRLGRGTLDMTFSARQLQEKSKEQHQTLYMAFFNLITAFNFVNREVLWRIFQRIRCLQKFVSIPRLLHDYMQAVVLTKRFNNWTFQHKNISHTRLRHRPDTILHLLSCCHLSYSGLTTARHTNLLSC